MRHLFDVGSSEYGATSDKERKNLVLTLFLEERLEKEIFEHRVYMNNKGYSDTTAIENLFNFLDTFSRAFHNTRIAEYLDFYREVVSCLFGFHLYERYKNELTNQLRFTEKESVIAENLVAGLVNFIYNNGIYEDTEYRLYRTKKLGAQYWLWDDLINTFDKAHSKYWMYSQVVDFSKKLNSSWRIPNSQDYKELIAHFQNEIYNWEYLDSLEQNEKVYKLFSGESNFNAKLNGIIEKSQVRYFEKKTSFWVLNKQTTLEKLISYRDFFEVNGSASEHKWHCGLNGGRNDNGRCLRLVKSLNV